MHRQINPTDRPLLQLDNVCLNFSGLQVLSGISSTIEHGEIVGIIGPNGSGKTTLFNIITGIYTPTQGEVLLEGRTIRNLKRHEIAAAGIMRTFQNPRVFGSLGLKSHIIIPARSISKPISFLNFIQEVRTVRENSDSTASDILRKARLHTEGEVLANTLPYGRRRLLEIARCLGGTPKLLLLDEPTAGLNRHETYEVQILLESLVETEGITIAVIDHDLEFLAHLCPRLIALAGGRVIYDGPQEEVLRNSEVIATYLGDR